PAQLARGWQRQHTTGVTAGLEVALELVPHRRDQPIALNKTDLIIHGRKSATRYVHKMGFQVATPLLDDRFNHVVSPACLSPGPSARPQCPESKWSQQVTDDGRLIADVKRVQQFLIQRIAM